MSAFLPSPEKTSDLGRVQRSPFQQSYGVRFRKAWMCSLLAVTVLIYTLFTRSSSFLPSAPSISHAVNDTLGFGKIYSISLPDHYSRRDELFLMEQASGLRFTYTDGVLGSAIAKENLPYIANPDLKPGKFGCWRSHVNTWRRLIEDNVETALIIEEDINFDVDIRSQIAKTAAALNALQGANGRLKRTDRSSIWSGGDWEMIWLGSCGERSHAANETDKWLAYDDDTVTSFDRMLTTFPTVLQSYGIQDIKDGRSGRRVVQRSVYPLCVAAYALTRKAALRLYYQTTRYMMEPTDNFIAGRKNLQAYTVVPPLFAQWKIENTRNSFIDAENYQPKFFNPTEGDSFNIRHKKGIRSHLKELYS